MLIKKNYLQNYQDFFFTNVNSILFRLFTSKFSFLNNNLKQKKINTVFYYITLHSSSFGKLKATTKSTMHNTNYASNNLLRLPLHTKLMNKNVARCC